MSSSTPLQTGLSRAAARRPVGPRFHRLTKQIHAYVGLVNFSILLVFGIVGLIALEEAGRPWQPPPVESVRELPYTAPANATDPQVALDVYRFLRPPLSPPPAEYSARRDADHDLVVSFYTADGPIQATVLENARQLRVERRRNGLGAFLSNVHSATFTEAGGTHDWRLRLWTMYTEVSIWSLLALGVSGVLLWLSSRPRYRPAWAAFGGGAAAFLLLYILVR